VLIHADAKAIPIEDCSVDSIVTDPPYGLKFMGKEWDHGIPGVPFWIEALRVAKPGAHLLAFGGTRTFHRLACAIEDAGWDIRDTIMWVYGSGFPKSHDVAKAIDAMQLYGGSNSKRIKKANDGRNGPGRYRSSTHNNCFMAGDIRGSRIIKDRPTTGDAETWQGWGTALKPAWEPIIVARKPLVGTVAGNVLKHGTGAINVDGCRVDSGADYHDLRVTQGGADCGVRLAPRNKVPRPFVPALGRWPANVIHDGSEEVVGLFARFGESKSTVGMRGATGRHDVSSPGTFNAKPYTNSERGHKDTGTAARFFYTAKASASDRGHESAAALPLFNEGKHEWRNTHPTVKPQSLMRYLCRLVTPPGGTVLDPFMGSGSTGVAAESERFQFIGVDLNSEYVEIAAKRLGQRVLGLDR
jgi:site-specific DNA-methyltransferase (adenine-specific)